MKSIGVKYRALIFIVAHNAARAIEKVVARIPRVFTECDTEILIIENGPMDETCKQPVSVQFDEQIPYKLTVLRNPVVQDYGASQKLGFQYALEKGFDVVMLLHADGKYAPELLPELLKPVVDGEADVVIGSHSRSITSALRDGMPLYEYVGNRMLTALQNLLLGSNISQFHCGCAVYTTNALKNIPFHLNTNDFRFDTEIIIQLLLAGVRLKELPVPTCHGDNTRRVNAFKYAWNVMGVTIVACLQRFCLRYKRNFDIGSDTTNNWFYKPKLDFCSPHTAALQEIRNQSRVLDIGCASGYLCGSLKDKGCEVLGIDKYSPAKGAQFDKFIQSDLDSEPWDLSTLDADYILLLDVIEHLRDPEGFVVALSESLESNRTVRIIVSSGNIAFVIPRLMLLAGQFNYGKKGILDLTHKRLFTFSSFKRLFEECGFEVVTEMGIPAPIPLVVPNKRVAGWLMSLNRLLIRLSKTLFSYQIYMVLRSKPSLKSLLTAAEKCSVSNFEFISTSSLNAARNYDAHCSVGKAIQQASAPAGRV